MTLTNRWNRLVYRLWSPFYDTMFGPLIIAARRQVIRTLDAQPGERILFVGVGTGLDLPLLPAGVAATGIDLSTDMLARANARLSPEQSLVNGDALTLPFPSGLFDGAVMNLVLSVVPQADVCLRETARVLGPGGRIVVFDKFAPDGARPTLRRRLLNAFTTLAGTDITRRLDDILAGSSCTQIRNDPAMLRGVYRIAVFQKTAERSS